VGILIRHHLCLCMSGIYLDRFHIPSIQLELIRDDFLSIFDHSSFLDGDFARGPVFSVLDIRQKF